MPARKPGIEYDNFPQTNSNSLNKLHQKTYSVPNLSQQQQQHTNENNIDNSDSASISSNGSSFMVKPPQPPNKFSNNENHLVFGVTKTTSTSNDTLVSNENKNHFTEPEVDYDDENEDDNVNIKTVPIPPPPPIMLTTFTANIKSSPLTPRQIKQRNSAKRTISRSDSQSNLNDNGNNHLQHSVQQNPPPPPPPPLPIVPPLTLSMTPQMINKNRTSSQPPITPTRTTSTLVYINNVTNKPVSNDEDNQTTPIIKSQTPSNGSNGSQSSDRKLNQQLSHQNELKIAIKNRIKRAAESPPQTPTKPQSSNNSVVIKSGIVYQRISNINNETSPQQTVLTNNNNKTSTFSKPINNENNDSNRRNLPRDPPPPPPPVTTPPALNGFNRHSLEIPVPPPPPNAQTNLQNDNLPPPPSPTQLNRLNKIISVTPVVKPISPPIKPNLSSPSGGVIIDPRTSSDFSALIAKKAAEKRAKFTETKPSVHAVTFQADGSKVFTTNSPVNVPDVPIEHNNSQQSITESPTKSYNNSKQNGNIFKKPLITTTTTNGQNNLKSLNNNSAAELGM